MPRGSVYLIEYPGVSNITNNSKCNQMLEMRVNALNNPVTLFNRASRHDDIVTRWSE